MAIRGYQRRRAPQLWLLAAMMTCALPSPFRALALPSAPPDPATRHAAARAVPKITPYELAAQMRSQMEAVPEIGRTRGEYTSVMDAFRSVYHNTPRDPKAPDSIYAVAQLLAEQGRIFGDARSSQAAVGQYQFLRQQYPATSLRISALLAEGQIEQNDLHDAAAAQAKFNELLRTYPRSAQADDARSALASMGVPAPAPAQNPAQNPTQNPAQNPAQAAAAVAASSPRTSPEAVAPEHHAAYTGALAQVTSIRHWSTPGYTRVVVQLGADVPYTSGRVSNPDRIYFDLHAAHLAHDLVGKSFDVTDNGYLKRIRVAQFSNNVTRVVLDVTEIADYSSFVLPDPYRLIIDIRSRSHADAKTSLADGSATGRLPAEATAFPPQPTVVSPSVLPSSPAIPPSVSPSLPSISPAISPSKTTAATVPFAVGTMQNTGYARPPDTPITTNDDPPAPVAVPAKKGKSNKTKSEEVVDDASPAHAADISGGERSLVRALGLKIGRIVIDAGHGGHDSGTIGPGGIEEKDVVLDVALRLGNLLRERLGAEVIYTRDDDTFIPLEQRTAIANQAKADLFISVHANSSSEPNVRGVEVYYLNFTSQPDALEVAARENAVANGSIYELSDLVKKITLKDKLDESREFAADVDGSLFQGLQKGNSGMKDRGVKKAPFMVLIGANMPSILCEIGFITNPKDATLMRDPTYDQRIADALYRGMSKYIGGLSGIRVAQAPTTAPARAAAPAKGSN
ncbi:MAG: N-acetylmuramoyl-L-alanine amidase [Acidobacteriaceae bacterium]